MHERLVQPERETAEFLRHRDLKPRYEEPKSINLFVLGNLKRECYGHEAIFGLWR